MTSGVPGLVGCCVYGGYRDGGGIQVMIFQRFDGNGGGGHSSCVVSSCVVSSCVVHVVIAWSFCGSACDGICALGAANGFSGPNCFSFSGCLLLHSVQLEDVEHERGNIADGFGGAKFNLPTAELVDSIGQQLDHGWLVVRFQGAEQDGSEIGDGLDGGEVHLATAEVIDGLGQQLVHIRGLLQRDGSEIGRQRDLGFGVTAANLSALLAGGGLFALLLGVVEKTIVLAGLGIGLAAGADFADVLATGLFIGSFNVVHIHLLRS